MSICKSRSWNLLNLLRLAHYRSQTATPLAKFCTPLCLLATWFSVEHLLRIILERTRSGKESIWVNCTQGTATMMDVSNGYLSNPHYSFPSKPLYGNIIAPPRRLCSKLNTPERLIRYGTYRENERRSETMAEYVKKKLEMLRISPFGRHKSNLHKAQKCVYPSQKRTERE